jgi:hypothetical protein
MTSCDEKNQELITYSIQERKWGWIGHTLRIGPRHSPHHALNRNSQRKRKRATPSTPGEELSKQSSRTSI